jgi:hypothetical protein
MSKWYGMPPYPPLYTPVLSLSAHLDSLRTPLHHNEVGTCTRRSTDEHPTSEMVLLCIHIHLEFMLRVGEVTYSEDGDWATCSGRGRGGDTVSGCVGDTVSGVQCVKR